ncbi:MAG: type I methionyl aminopeptidase [Bacteriovoracaceae bacterium]
MKNSTITLKSPEEIELMREGGKKLARILAEAKDMCAPGISLDVINDFVGRLCLKYQVKPSFKDYDHFPANICISLNDEVVHGIPTKNKVIVSGDVVSLDFGALYQGFNTDSAITFVVGESSRLKEKLIRTAEKSFLAGVRLVKPGVRLGDISHEIEHEIEKSNFKTVKCLAGHGIGREVHEPPIIPNFGKKGTGIILEEGMTLAIEPMVTEKSYDLFLKEDGWTYATVDGGLSSHFEHTLAVVKDGYRILTQP